MSLVCGPHVVEWVAKRTNEYGGFARDAQAVGWERGGRLTGGVVYCDWNGVNVCCHTASDGSRRWLSPELLWAIFDYPFNQLRVNWMTASIGEGNKESRRFVEKLGFTQEANLQGRHPTGALIVYGLHKKDCRFLREPYAITRPDLLRAAA